jgi:hypothetical protein
VVLAREAALPHLLPDLTRHAAEAPPEALQVMSIRLKAASRLMSLGAATMAISATPRVQRLLDVAGHLQRVACDCFSTISSSPGTSLMMASPMGGGEPMTTSASPIRSGRVARPCRRAGAPPARTHLGEAAVYGKLVSNGGGRSGALGGRGYSAGASYSTIL